jgi:transposase-like protein
MRELSVAEQRYQAVLAVIGDGETVTEVAARFGVARKTVHAWLVRYEAGGLEGEVAIAGLRQAHPSWEPRRLVVELAKRRRELGLRQVRSESAVYRALIRLGLIDRSGRRPRWRRWRRWERGAPMELWQMDVVGGFVLADGRRAKALTGVDDHSRFCVSAQLMLRESSQRICAGPALALRTHGVPEANAIDSLYVNVLSVLTAQSVQAVHLRPSPHRAFRWPHCAPVGRRRRPTLSRPSARVRAVTP